MNFPPFRGPAASPPPDDDERTASVRRAFARAAPSYDEHAEIQAVVAAELLNRIRLAGRPVRKIHEIGCGTGRFTLALAEAFPAAELFAIDLCPEMVARTEHRCRARPDLAPRISLEVKDAERFAPAERGTYDLIVSSGALQWCRDLAGTFARGGAALAAGGEFHAALFGPETYRELRDVLAREMLPPGESPTLPAAAGFADREAVAAALAGTFTDFRLEVTHLRQEFPDLPALLRHLRRTGTSGRHWRGSLSPGRLRRWEAAYRAACGGIVAGYEIFYLKAAGPRPELS